MTTPAPLPEPPRDVRLVLRPLPLPGGAPADVRLRRFLKYALRAWGFRCLWCEEICQVPGPPPAVPEPGRVVTDDDGTP